LAKYWHCGTTTKASSHRIASSKPAYSFQHVRHCLKCKVCGKELMEWRGEYHEPDKFTDWLTIPKSEYPHWLRRIATEQAKPEAQLMSEYSQQASRPADVVGPYLLKLTQAHRWYKGNKL
jgi:hypothetical protein